MIRVYKPKDCRPYTPTVIDIETAPDGAVIAVGFAYQMEGDTDVTYRHYQDYGEWWSDYCALYAQSRATKRGANRLNRVFAHNGANFDYLSFYEYLAGSGRLKDSRYLTAGSTGIGAYFSTTDNVEVTCLDSFRLMPASLDKLSHTFGVENLKEKVPEDCQGNYLLFKERYPALFWSYLRSDVLGLQQVIKKFWNMIVDQFGSIGELPLTLPGIGMRLFRKQLDAPIYTPDDPKLKAFERAAYKGGLTLCMHTGSYENVHIYDVNSMYPSVMVGNLFPASYRGYWTHHYNPRSIGLWQASFTQSDRYPPVLFDDQNGAKWQGRGVYTTQEINYARSIGASIDVEHGYIYRDRSRLFDKLITRIYTTRREAQSRGDEALAFTLKILMNSIYGKFAQREEGYTIELGSIERIRELRQNGTPFKLLGDWLLVAEHRQVPHAFCAIAAHITAYARIKLHTLMREHTDRYGLETLLYCDTDSIHVTAGTYADSSELGGLKLEAVGSGVYAGKKIYSVAGKTKAKGIGRHLTQGTLDEHTISVLANDKNATSILSFMVAPSVKEVLSNKRHSAVFFNRTRTLRNTGGIYDA